MQVNAAAARIVGATVEELDRHNFRASQPWRRYGLLAACERALAGGHLTEVQTQMVTEFGKSLWLGVTFTPFHFQDRPHVLVAFQDLSTDEDTLARLKLLESALEAAPDAFVITDTHGRVEWVNSAFTSITGYNLDEMRGRNPNLLKSGRQDDAFYKNLWETITKGAVWVGELQNARKDGGIYWEHMTIAPVMSATGSIHHYVAVKRDITAHKEMEQQMARTQRLESIGLLAGGIAHDLNNVLAPILMAMDLFKLKYPADEDQKRLELVRQSAERGAKIVKQVLAFARGVEGERVAVKPRHLLKEVRSLLQETLPRNIDIDFVAGRDGAAVKGDVTQLHQVLMNLAVNARDAMPQGGTLTLALAEEHLVHGHVTRSGLALSPGHYVVLVVRDTGCGIAEQVLDKIFDPFFTTKARGEGTGLGLPSVLGIVRSHRGGLEVSSQVGVGTEFKVYLPAEPASVSRAPFEIGPSGVEGGGVPSWWWTTRPRCVRSRPWCWKPGALRWPWPWMARRRSPFSKPTRPALIW